MPLQAIRTVAERVPDDAMVFVDEAYAEFSGQTFIPELAAFPNVFCKLSGLVTEADWKSWKPEYIAPYLDIALECFGPERLVIGSDWPVCTVAGSYAQVMNLVLDFVSKYPEDLRNAILGGNAEKFWNLSPLLDELC